MNPMPPIAPGQPPAAAAIAINPEEIASETGFPLAKVQSDIEQSGAATKEELYPEFYGGGQQQPQGIDPALAAAAGGYEEEVPMNEAMPVQGGAPPLEQAGLGAAAPVEDEGQNRLAARAAMSGQPMPLGPGETTGPPPEDMLGLGAAMRKPSGVHDRARKMGRRF